MRASESAGVWSDRRETEMGDLDVIASLTRESDFRGWEAAMQTKSVLGTYFCEGPPAKP
jgi:hypothetical protein